MQNAIHQNTVTRNSVPRMDPTVIPVSLAAITSAYKSGLIYVINQNYGETYFIKKLVFVHAQVVILALIVATIQGCLLFAV